MKQFNLFQDMSPEQHIELAKHHYREYKGWQAHAEQFNRPDAISRQDYDAFMDLADEHYRQYREHITESMELSMAGIEQNLDEMRSDMDAIKEILQRQAQ